LRIFDFEWKFIDNLEVKNDRDELKRRTMEFALRIIKLVNALPKNAAGRVICNQLLRVETSIGANYSAACKAKSKSAIRNPTSEMSGLNIFTFIYVQNYPNYY
jgi:hypothetical protein